MLSAGLKRELETGGIVVRRRLARWLRRRRRRRRPRERPQSLRRPSISHHHQQQQHPHASTTSLPSSTAAAPSIIHQRLPDRQRMNGHELPAASQPRLSAGPGLAYTVCFCYNNNNNNNNIYSIYIHPHKSPGSLAHPVVCQRGGRRVVAAPARRPAAPVRDQLDARGRRDRDGGRPAHQDHHDQRPPARTPAPAHPQGRAALAAAADNQRAGLPRQECARHHHPQLPQPHPQVLPDHLRGLHQPARLLRPHDRDRQLASPAADAPPRPSAAQPVHTHHVDLLQQTAYLFLLALFLPCQYQ
ncbi:uncharacterized protein TERG_11820 [Trichophyton rubrum CBS 118892]|uniref:Uncharacterized protein n=1 Tax=Trichophyton rubrum (strain ATCC MYA-4607 / CBS 118892) TaxID=559305 RepID=A0A080WF18_TRIRC|nr:uncharacterized protein TERG_11820 [Trichophyton rubrum CBS 118892]KFL60811.1 hypothetical protein TERG_11820 [Trichophyton rubrum CBS 118892]